MLSLVYNTAKDSRMESVPLDKEKKNKNDFSQPLPSTTFHSLPSSDPRSESWGSKVNY